MSLKNILKNFSLTKGLYKKLKAIKDKRDFKNKTKTKHIFINRSNNNKKLCIVLAGYKKFLYDNIFFRLKSFLPDDVDVCIMTSGLYSKEIEEMCETNKWSYLSTKANNVSLIQNLAITLHPEAEYIYKIDEDIFITKNFFEKMYKTLLHAETESQYKVGFVAPLIPINGYGHLRILETLDLVKEYEKRFEKPLYCAGPSRMVENNPDVAKFLWGGNKTTPIPQIDKLNELFEKNPFKFSVCPIRFSIGAILFKRDSWLDMGMYSVNRKTNAMGQDEYDFCCLAMSKSRAIIVSENTVVGHLSFGKQNEEMKNYYLNNKEIFELKK